MSRSGVAVSSPQAKNAAVWQDGELISVIGVDLAGGCIAEIYWIANPDKLARCGHGSPR